MRASTPRSIVALLITLALAAVSCGSSSPDADSAATTAAPSSTAPSTTAPPTTAAPTTTVVVQPAVDVEAVLAETEAELLSALKAWMGESMAPGASMSVRLPGQEPINVASGVADIVTDEPVTTESYFRIGSITKTITAATVMQLVDEGLIELDEPMRTYLPGWLEGYEYADEITVRQAMDHTNGLKEYALDPVFFQVAGQRLDEAIAPEEIEAWLASQDPLFAPGEQYSYETGGFLSLGRVIETVTGNSAAAEIRARIFEPAGAENIFLTPEEFPPTSTVNGYGRDLMYVAGTVLVGRPDTEGLTIGDDPVVAMFTLPQDVLQSAGWTGGGGEAQLESVSAVYGALFNGTILTPAQIDEMTTPVLDVNYGLGVSNDDIDGIRVYSHGGGVPGFRSQAGYLPDHDASYAMSVNLVPLPDGTDVGVLQREIVPILVEAVERLGG
ncbi:MAG: serine hydrolase domain-containing protein [Acidimicrobiales bacterium]